jgi:protein-S-isoprenylcysteine O-methyltransferase Ste14
MPHVTRPVPGALACLCYAVAGYLLMLAVTGYAIGFFAGAGVPKGIDQGAWSPWPLAVAIDAGLLLLFAVQHTVMARPWFKRRWTRLVPAPAERSTFVVAASLALALLFWLWRPVRGTVWQLSGVAGAVLWALYLAGWAVAWSATFMISHADLFGLRQAYLHWRGTAYRPPPFTERGLYGRIRHPLMAGFLVVFWAAPVMTLGHLLLATLATGYILAGIWFEERDARRDLGGRYRAYAARVPALIPRPGQAGRRAAQAGRQAASFGAGAGGRQEPGT